MPRLSTGRLRTSQTVVEGSCILDTVMLRADGTNAASCIIHDGRNIGGDLDAKYEANVFAGGRTGGRDGIGIKLQKGMYVELVGVGAYVIIEYRRGE